MSAAAGSSDPEKPTPSSIAKPSGQLNGLREPLINSGNYSLRAVILPFLFPAFGGLLYGYDIGATSSGTISLQSPSVSGISWYNLSSVQVGLITSGSLYGALIGSILAFKIADFLGRRKELLLSSTLYLVGALVTALAPNFVVMVIGRLVFGIGIGLVRHLSILWARYDLFTCEHSFFLRFIYNAISKSLALGR